MNTSEPTIDGVVKTVNMITAQWQAQKKQGRFGRTRVLFHKLCGTLNSHSALIKLLPEGSEYISVFTGTLHAIIKVLPDVVQSMPFPNRYCEINLYTNTKT